MQGRMEFGPRALGNRSILASPLNPYSTENLNIYIKHREPFRKFAASVPEELAPANISKPDRTRAISPPWDACAPSTARLFEAAVLGDDAVRVHTVHQEDNPLFHKLLHAAGKATGLPVLYNTSFNFSAIRWCARRATPCAAFIPRVSMRCSWEISWSKSSAAARHFAASGSIIFERRSGFDASLVRCGYFSPPWYSIR